MDNSIIIIIIIIIINTLFVTEYFLSDDWTGRYSTGVLISP
jgi:uncharacterized protein YebE (UPF0316 family)